MAGRVGGGGTEAVLMGTETLQVGKEGDNHKLLH